MAKPPPLTFRASPATNATVTRPRLSRSFGTLTILYAVAMILYGLLSLSIVSLLPWLGGMFDQLQSQQTDMLTERRQRALRTLEEAEAQASTPEAKAQVKVDRMLLERTEVAPMMGTSIPGMGMFDDPAGRIGLKVDTGIKLGINVLLLIAGFGLLRGTSWARSLGLGVAGLKIVALIVLTIISMRTVVEPMARGWTADIKKTTVQASDGAEPSADAQRIWTGFEATMERSFGTTIVLFAALGLLYPILLIVLLTRPKVRAELAPAVVS